MALCTQALEHSDEKIAVFCRPPSQYFKTSTFLYNSGPSPAIERVESRALDLSKSL